jgi:hypothetical protein
MDSPPEPATGGGRGGYDTEIEEMAVGTTVATEADEEVGLLLLGDIGTTELGASAVLVTATERDVTGVWDAVALSSSLRGEGEAVAITGFSNPPPNVLLIVSEFDSPSVIGRLSMGLEVI